MQVSTETEAKPEVRKARAMPSVPENKSRKTRLEGWFALQSLLKSSLEHDIATQPFRELRASITFPLQAGGDVVVELGGLGHMAGFRRIAGNCCTMVAP